MDPPQGLQDAPMVPAEDAKEAPETPKEHPREPKGSRKGTPGVHSMPSRCPKRHCGSYNLTTAKSQRPWNKFQGQVFACKSGMNGLVTETSYSPEASAYLRVNGNPCPPER